MMRDRLKKEGHKEESAEEGRPRPASGLLALGPRYLSAVLWLSARGGRAFDPIRMVDPYGLGEGAWEPDWEPLP